MTDNREEGPPTLDYGIEEPRRLRPRDSTEYYREPPAISRITPGAVLLWIVSFFVAAGLLFWWLMRSVPVIR